MPAKKPKLLIAAAVVAAGSAAVYFYFQGLSQQISNPQESAKVVPDEATRSKVNRCGLEGLSRTKLGRHSNRL
jgi:hypothetical protein